MFVYRGTVKTPPHQNPAGQGKGLQAHARPLKCFPKLQGIIFVYAEEISITQACNRHRRGPPMQAGHLSEKSELWQKLLALGIHRDAPLLQKGRGCGCSQQGRWQSHRVVFALPDFSDHPSFGKLDTKVDRGGVSNQVAPFRTICSVPQGGVGHVWLHCRCDQPGAPPQETP
uniref:Uncharacterized protein n=1 Tax=Sphaerodactylus townsendi TaxID=933632 RepID=A0ACB8F3M4_9SAUR